MWQGSSGRVLPPPPSGKHAAYQERHEGTGCRAAAAPSPQRLTRHYCSAHGGLEVEGVEEVAQGPLAEQHPPVERLAGRLQEESLGEAGHAQNVGGQRRLAAEVRQLRWGGGQVLQRGGTIGGMNKSPRACSMRATAHVRRGFWERITPSACALAAPSGSTQPCQPTFHSEYSGPMAADTCCLGAR